MSFRPYSNGAQYTGSVQVLFFQKLTLIAMVSHSIVVFFVTTVLLYYFNTLSLLQKGELQTVGSIDYRALPLTMKSFLFHKAQNHTVLLMIADYGYLNMWNNAYITGKLSHYRNLVVFCLDRESYRVFMGKADH